MSSLRRVENLEKGLINLDFPSIKVSMITAYSNQYYDAAMEYGAEHYFTKPLDFNMLKQEILKG